MVTVTCLIIWAFLAIPDFGLWVLLILVGIAVVSFLADAEWIFFWWWD